MQPACTKQHHPCGCIWGGGHPQDVLFCIIDPTSTAQSICHTGVVGCGWGDAIELLHLLHQLHRLVCHPTMTARVQQHCKCHVIWLHTCTAHLLKMHQGTH